MNPPKSTNILEHEDYPEATVIRLCIRRIGTEEDSQAVRNAIYSLEEVGHGPIILDLSNVEQLTSATLGWLLTLRSRLRQGGSSFQAPCRRRGLFAIHPDVAAALDAIRGGEADALVLCGIRDDIREVFQVC